MDSVQLKKKGAYFRAPITVEQYLNQNVMTGVELFAYAHSPDEAD